MSEKHNDAHLTLAYKLVKDMQDDIDPLTGRNALVKIQLLEGKTCHGYGPSQDSRAVAKNGIGGQFRIFLQVV